MSTKRHVCAAALLALLTLLTDLSQYSAAFEVSAPAEASGMHAPEADGANSVEGVGPLPPGDVEPGLKAPSFCVNVSRVGY